MSSKEDDGGGGEKGSICGGVEKEAGEEERKTNITHLPEDVLRLIIVELGGLSLTETNRHFYNVRRHLYLRLSRTYSRKYHEEEDFRIVVHSRVENPSNQLRLTLRGCSNITDVSALGGVHTLDLWGCNKITDVSALDGVHTLIR